MITLDANVPIPTGRNYALSAAMRAAMVDRLGVGDSFFVTAKPANVKALANRVRKQSGRKFSVIKEGEGVRVFRLS